MKNFKRLFGILSILCLALALIACSNNSGTSSNKASYSNLDGAQVEKNSDAFSSDDYGTDEEANALVVLEEDAGTISDTTRGSSGEDVEITSKGVYEITGESTNVTVIINDTTKSGNIYLTLNNVTMNNSSKTCIYVKSADKVIITLVGENSITTTFTESYTDDTNNIDGAIYSKDDLTITGTGSLTITSALHGIVSKDDFKVLESTLTINATKKGMDVNDSVRIASGTINIASGSDGIQLSNDEGDSYYYQEGGAVTIKAGYDGIDASGATSKITLYDGTLNITAGGGSNKSKNSTISQKGLKSDADIEVGGGTLTVSSADDSLHAAGTIVVSGGTLNLSSSDDGIHSDKAISISGGETTITKSYEGIEAFEIYISGGNINIKASDDGLNAAGDTQDSDTRTNPWSSTSSTGTFKISGGNLYVNASGDGLDTNGSGYITGGYIIVEGPTNSGNGALDKGDGTSSTLSITGGTVLAIGSSGMALNFDSGTQCSMLVSLSGSSGTTITVDDGSGFSFTTTKSFQTVVYSSPSMTKGNTYKITAGSSSVTVSFSSSLYYSNAGGGVGGGMMQGGGRR